MKFSIIVVCLNPGKKLNQTLDSILEQTYGEYEVIVKDGASTDGAVEEMRREERIRLFTEKDSGIYEAMNQAVSHVRGDLILFLNCGDTFYSKTVLEETAAYAAGFPRVEKLVLYGDTFSEKTGALIASPPRITGFTCFRNIPCHQSCFYGAGLCREKPYDPQYRIRADYDHFLWCYYVGYAEMVHMDVIVSSYEGGGYSESRENKKRDQEEHRLITSAYMNRKTLIWYRFLMLCTLAPLRRFLAENKLFSGGYHWIKKGFYALKK